MATRARKVTTSLSAPEGLARGAISREEQRAWLADNAQAIAGYNDFVDEHGVFSDRVRRF